MLKRERISVLPARLFGNPGRIAHSFREHQAVLEAIIDGDEAAANGAMMAHDSTSGEAYAALVLRAP